MIHPKFIESPSGYPVYIAPDGTEIVKTVNEEGIVAYWKPWDAGDGENKGRVMMTYEDMVKYDLDRRGVMGSFANGDKFYGNIVLELVKRNPDRSVEYIRHDYGKKFQ